MYTNYDPCAGLPEKNPMLYIPLRDEFPELDRILEKQPKNQFSFLYVKPKEEIQSTPEVVHYSDGYALETMFDCYRDSIPHYTYDEFKNIVQRELNSIKSDDEVMGSLLETFGYDVFDFLNEIIRHRYKKIDYDSISLYVDPGDINKKPVPSAVIAGQVTVQSEKESVLVKKLRKMEKKEKSKYSTAEIKQ